MDYERRGKSRKGSYMDHCFVLAKIADFEERLQNECILARFEALEFWTKFCDKLYLHLDI